ncbi:hypothetical protein BOX15_Mlig019819g1 [Macrostomum lignano]|uniref:BTB domain-containing protein n=1 Tax=Macrostomum lignano TaxID=282301 RepID=A0A267EB41_9PLAT|nr:hypothetical protein BOX15_Mlig019819g1 [Macrostomum lignano]
MDGLDEQDLKRAELDYCLKNSLNFVDTQALAEARKGNGDVSEADNEEETPDEWLVDVRYTSRLLKKANEMRIKKRLCDLTIGLKDGKLEAHKSMLAAGSPFFKHLTETTRASTLNFFHVTCSVADILFDFMYTGEVSIEKAEKLGRSERQMLREKAELFEVDQQLQALWDRLGVATKNSGKQSQQAEHQEVPLEDASEIVKRKVLYMNDRRKQGDFADWKIRISAVDIPVSKVFLAASSTYFADFFARNPMEAKSETYTLTELNRRTFRKVLNFIYTGHVITTGRDLAELKDLLFQASYLGVGDLSSRLVEEFESRLTTENCFAMFSYSNSINCRQLFKSVSHFIGRMGAKWSHNSGFLGLEFNDLRAALLNPDLRFDGDDSDSDEECSCLPWPVDFESRTLDLLIAWIRVDRVRRSSHVTELFDLVDRLGRLPYTGRREEMHQRLPAELNNVMSAYYLKLIKEQQGKTCPTKQPSPQTKQSPIRARRYLFPTQLLMSREFHLAGPQLPGSALLPTKLQSSPDEEELRGCWQLSPTEWRLQSIEIQASDQELTWLSGLKLIYQRYPMLAKSEDPPTELRTFCCGYRGSFQHSIELDETERVVQLGLGSATAGSSGRRSYISWLKTCKGRRLQVPVAAAASETTSVSNSNQSADENPTTVVKSPKKSHGFLHGFGLRFSEAGGGAMTIVWAVETDVDGLGDSPWSSVVENE